MYWITSKDLPRSDKTIAIPGAEPAGIRKYCTPTIKAISTVTRTVDFIITTDKPDRDGDIINPKGWDLKSFKANPVVLWSHDYGTPPIAKAIKIGKVEGGLRSRAEFVPAEVSPFAESIFQMIKGGFLNAASVGFRPTEFAFNEKRGGTDFTKQELLEWSIVPVPANADATVLEGLKAKGINLKPLLEWGEQYLSEGDHDKDEVAVVKEYCTALGSLHVPVAADVETEEKEIEDSWEDEPELKTDINSPTPEQAEIATKLDPLIAQAMASGTSATTQGIKGTFSVEVPQQSCQHCQKECTKDELIGTGSYDEAGETKEELLLCAECTKNYILVDIQEPTQYMIELIDDEIEKVGIDEATAKEAIRALLEKDVVGLITHEVQHALAYQQGRII